MGQFKRNQPILVRDSRGTWALRYFYMQKGQMISYKTWNNASYVEGTISVSHVIDAVPFETGMKYGCDVDPRAVALEKIKEIEQRQERFRQEIEGLEADIIRASEEIEALRKTITN